MEPRTRQYAFVNYEPYSYQQRFGVPISRQPFSDPTVANNDDVYAVTRPQLRSVIQLNSQEDGLCPVWAMLRG